MPSKKHALATDTEAPSGDKAMRIDPPPPPPQPLDVATPPSASRKKASAGPARTGQACDRCKTRKIRCDNTEGGCLPCKQNNTECKTTDRITQRATVRGHTEILERENDYLRQQLYAAEQQLREAGIELRAPPARDPYTHKWSPDGAAQTWPDGQAPSESYRYQPIPEGHDPQKQDANMFSALPTFRGGLVGDNYLGVSSGNESHISPIKGTCLSLFGVNLDLAEFLPASLDDEASPMSYQSVLSSFMKQPPQSIDEALKQLPKTYDECSKHTEFFLLALNPWFPVFDKQAFRSLVVRVYQGVRPSAAEIVMIHMALANIKYQMCKRNWDGAVDNAGYEQSFAHYRCALSFFPQLVRSRTIADMQALAIICHHVRSFPKSGAAWMMSTWVLSIAIEMGYHRSTDAWRDDPSRTDPMENELRKRVFWAMLMINVSLSGKLGRPMPLRPADFDVELPKALDDLDRPEANAPISITCSYRGTLEFFKLTEIFLETYNCIYAIRQTTDYEDSVQRIEAKIETWRQGVPPELKDSSLFEKDMRIRVFALWIQYWECECQLLLHHPALCKSNSPEFIKRNLIICTAASSRLIQAVGQLAQLRSLDTTWYNITTYICAIFTLLFSAWCRRDDLSADEFAQLEADMNVCLEIMGPVGGVLGTGLKLKDSVSAIIDDSLKRINQARAEKTASAAVASSQMKQGSQSSELRATKSEEQRSPPQTHGLSTSNPEPERDGLQPYRSNSYPVPGSHSSLQSQSPYPVGTQAYVQHSSVPVTNYPYHSYDSGRGSYPMSNGGINGQHVAGDGQFSLPAHHGGSYDGLSAWQEFMDSSAKQHMVSEGYQLSAGHALMSLNGGRGMEQGDATHASPYIRGPMSASAFHPIVAQQIMSAEPGAQQWPLNVYEDPRHQNSQ